METSTSSIVSALGSGSGVDMVKLAGDLAAARFSVRIQQLEGKSDLLETQISAASSLRSQLSLLANALGDRIRNGDLAPQPTIGNSSVATVTAAPGAASSGSYSLEVEQLAASQTLASKPYASTDAAVGEGTLTITFGTVGAGTFNAEAGRDPVVVSVAAGATLAQVAASITAGGSGVTAYVANGPDGAQLVFKGTDGASGGFIVQGAGASASGTDGSGNPVAAQPGNINYLDWNPAGDTGELRQNAQDARFKFDTISMTSATNRVDDLPGGLSLTLTGTNIGAPTRISFVQGSGAIQSVMGDFVAALNDIAANLRETADPLTGELGRDPGARALKRALSGLTSSVVMPNAAAGEPRTLGDLGVALNRDGTFRLDSSRLGTTMAENSAAANAMFTTGVFGVFATMDKLSREMGTTSNPGTLAGSVARYTRSGQRIDEQLARISQQQDALRAQLTTQFARTDRNVAASQSTLSFLQNQIAAFNADRN